MSQIAYIRLMLPKRLTSWMLKRSPRLSGYANQPASPGMTGAMFSPTDGAIAGFAGAPLSMHGGQPVGCRLPIYPQSIALDTSQMMLDCLFADVAVDLLSGHRLVDQISGLTRVLTLE